MGLAILSARICERWHTDMQGKMLTYVLPQECQTEQLLVDDSDVQVMFDLYKHEGRSLINIQMKAAEGRSMSTHASRPTSDPKQVLRESMDFNPVPGRTCTPPRVGPLSDLDGEEPLQLTGSSLAFYEQNTTDGGPLVPALTQYFSGRIHSVGQVFTSKDHLRMELTNYAMTKDFNWKFLKNDSVRLTVMCKNDACPWRLHASVVGGGPEFAIETMTNYHNCGCDIRSEGHPRASKKWVANIVKEKLVDTPIYRASEMKKDIRRDYGVTIPYHQVM